jgi:chaperonin GroES
MKKEKSQKFNLKALNDIVIIIEDDPRMEAGRYTGFTREAIEALKSGKLVAPDIAEDAVKKYPGTGEVISVGPKVKMDIHVGNQVMVSRFGGQREEMNGKTILFVRESEVIAVVGS